MEEIQVVGSSTRKSLSRPICDKRALTSNTVDKTERIRARQERIRKRIDSNGDEGDLDEIRRGGRPPLAYECLQKNTQELYKLELESEEVISNVRVANEAKEAARRRQNRLDRKRR